MADILSLRKSREAPVALLPVDYDDQVWGIVPDSHVKPGSTVQRTRSTFDGTRLPLHFHSTHEAHFLNSIAYYDKVLEATGTMIGLGSIHRAAKLSGLRKLSPARPFPIYSLD